MPPEEDALPLLDEVLPPLGIYVVPEEVPVPVVEGVVELALVDPVVPVELVLSLLFICCLKRSFLNLNTVPHIVVDAVRLSVEDDEEDEDEEVDDGAGFDVVRLCVVPVPGFVSAFVSVGVVCCSSPPPEISRPIYIITRMIIANAANSGEPLKFAIFETRHINYPPPVPLELAPVSPDVERPSRFASSGSGAVSDAVMPAAPEAPGDVSPAT